MPPVAAILALRARAARLLEGVFVRPTSRADSLRDRLGVWLAHPLLGLPVLAFVLYVGFYWIVGQIAAGTLVKLLEEGLFGGYVNVWLDALFTKLVPGPGSRRSSSATTACSRSASRMRSRSCCRSSARSSSCSRSSRTRATSRAWRCCATACSRRSGSMAARSSRWCSASAARRWRPSRRARSRPGARRVIATLLLVLAVPCSAQLGLITGLLAMHGFTLWLAYLGCLLAIFLAVGWLAARVLPGSGATFHMEMPPLRWPRISNVLRKTWMRLVWYFREVVPLFLWASVILWALDQTKVLLALQHGIEPAMALIGLPVSAAESFLIGFFRRDFGAAGLFSLAESTTSLTSRQLLTGSVTLTLFVPCVASFMMMCKERGWRVGLAIFVLVTVFALGAGGC
jgi:ferrous iron transport protein B